jgi:hypothetical protein
VITNIKTDGSHQSTLKYFFNSIIEEFYNLTSYLKQQTAESVLLNKYNQTLTGLMWLHWSPAQKHAGGRGQLWCVSPGRGLVL